MNNDTLFISDLHLCPNAPQVTEQFLAFLNNTARHAAALYILGDFFESWVGDDCPDAIGQAIIDALRALTLTGIPTYFIAGNRDFLIGKRFAAATGITLLNDPTPITLHQQRYLLSHGDYLCIDDHAHQRFRRLYTNHFCQRLFLLLPKSTRARIATRARQASKQRHRSAKAYLGEINHPYAIQESQRMDCQHIIHGHTHRPTQDTLTHDGQHVQRVTLPAWDHQPGYLCINEESCQLVYL